MEAAELGEVDADALGTRGLDLDARVVGLDGQLTVTAIDEDGELDGAGTAVVHERIESGADGAAGVQHVVDEDHATTLERVAGDLGLADHGLRQARGSVVTVQRDVDGAAHRRGQLAGLLEQPSQAIRERHSGRADADEHELGAAVTLDDLVRDAPERALHPHGIERLPTFFVAHEGIGYHAPTAAQRGKEMRAPGADMTLWFGLMAPPAHTAAIALIGDELLSGKVVDENAKLLVSDLRELGVALRRIVVLPDVVDEIAETVRTMSAGHEIVITSGGVGPTHDDLTMEGIARAFDTTVVRHPVLETRLRAHYGARLEERNLRMAEVPDGAHLVGAGDDMTWPVVAYRNVYILPGVPQIFRRKWEAIRERFRQAPFHLRSVYVTLDEGAMAHHLDAVVAQFADVQVGSYPKIGAPDYRVKVTLESKNEASAQGATDALVLLLGAGVVRVE